MTITHVNKNEHGVITHVMTSDEKIYTKWNIITNIKLHVCVLVPSGAKVHVVDGKYIRSDANDTLEDNLGKLPSFELPANYHC
ncbi:MAG: DUF3892 domain-containing protein [Planctomycetaceae bacterium]|jgi:hypothetical protein|nr:DUF3892 domain-containing protein [Planctomycetaceae bacterium]